MSYSFKIIKFSGLQATQKASKQLLQWDGLKTANTADEQPYIGDFPPALIKASGLSNEQLSAFFDTTLTPFLTENRYKLKQNDETFFPLIPPSGKVTVFKFFKKLFRKNKSLLIKRIGSGGFGRVYRIQVQGEKPAYSLKVFDWVHAAYEEAAIGAYFTAQNTKDLSQLHITNPEKCWSVKEFIDETASLDQRTGKTLAEQGYFFVDDWSSNRIQGIRIDHGCLGSYRPRFNNITPPLAKGREQS